MASKTGRRASLRPLAPGLAQAEHLFRSGNPGGAEVLLREILARNPRNTKANELMAYIAGNRGNLEDAFRFLSTATADAAASPGAWYYLGVCLQKMGRHGDALKAAERSLAIGGDYFEGLHDLGLCCFNVGDPGRAVAAFDRAIAMRPSSFEAHFNKGRALDELRYFEDALAAYDRACALRPGDAGAWCNRGGALHDLGKLEEALASFDKALALSRDHANAWSGRGVVLQDMERYVEAQESFGRALAIDPGNAEFGFNHSNLLLLMGDFERGFPAYEARLHRDRTGPVPHAGLPRWSGDAPIQGKRILVWAEQGLGDTIQFCRYAPLLARQGAQVTVEVQPALMAIAASLEGCNVIAKGGAMPECDFQVPMMSLPAALGTRLDTVPGHVPYLGVDPQKVRLWSERLGPGDGRPRVGISCSGNPGQRNDRNRSVPLAEFSVLQDVAELFVVQKGIRSADEGFLRESGGFRYLGDDIGDFGDTAAIMVNLDLVISVDSSMTHLAGALGRPVWVLLAKAGGWRWMIDRNDSPWYPTARLFRQTKAGDWKEVMARVRKAIPT